MGIYRLGRYAPQKPNQTNHIPGGHTAQPAIYLGNGVTAVRPVSPAEIAKQIAKAKKNPEY